MTILGWEMFLDFLVIIIEMNINFNGFLIESNFVVSDTQFKNLFSFENFMGL